MTFLCGACGHEAGYVDHEVALAPDRDSRSEPRRLSIGHRHATRVWSELGITRDQAIAARRVRRVSYWLCTSPDCGAIVEHDRPVLPGVLRWSAGVLNTLAIALFLIASVVIPLVAPGVLSIPRRAEFQLGVTVAFILWILGWTVVIAFQETLARWRFKSDWISIRPACCTRCGRSRLQPLILPRRITESRRRSRPGAASAAACPTCRARAYWLVKRRMA